MPDAGFNAPKFIITDQTGARMVRGHRMGLIKDGWLVFYEDNRSPPAKLAPDELCVLETIDGRVMIRVVRPGRRPSRYDLLTATGEPELDVELVWAEVVTWIKPYRPSEAEVASITSAVAG